MKFKANKDSARSLPVMEESASQPIRYSLHCNILKNHKIKQKISWSTSQLYYILNYDKPYLCFDDKEHVNYRSVIMSYPECGLLSFSPPKSLDVAAFMQKYPPSSLHDIVVNELIEGVMIHLFFDTRTDQWEIGTKAGIGGKYNYYNYTTDQNFQTKEKPTFYRMFMDAFGESEDLNSLPFVRLLEQNISYTFVLQHPENKIIMPVSRPVLYLVAAYEINHLENYAEYIPPTVYEKWPVFHNVRGIVEFPRRCDYSNDYRDIIEQYCSIQSSITQRGIVFTHILTGERACIECPAYETIKQTVHIPSNVQYHYLCLSRIGKVGEYLTHFPKCKKMFFKLRNDYREFINNVHDSYVNYYVHKNATHIVEKYMCHIFKIHHTIYLPSLSKSSAQRKIITRGMAKEYFRQIDPRELLYMLNWDQRQMSIPV